MKCDYCGYHQLVGGRGNMLSYGDQCPKCKKGTMCEKGKQGNP